MDARIVEKVAMSELPSGMMKSDAHVPQTHQFVSPSTNRVKTCTIAEVANASLISSDAPISTPPNLVVSSTEKDKSQD